MTSVPHHARRGCFVLLPLALIWPRALRGQDMADYWAGLERASTVALLQSVPRPASDGGFVIESVTDGLKRIRLYELTYQSHVAREARHLLESTVIRGPSYAWAHFALGVALARGPDVRVRPYADRSAWFVDPNSNAAARAPRELRRALELDPDLDAAAFALGRLALDLADRALMTEAMQRLGKPRLADEPGSLLLRAELADRLGRTAQAAIMADMAVEYGGDASVAAHVAAAARFRVPGREARAAEQWLAGLDDLSSDGESTYFDALRAIMSESEIEQWSRADAAARRNLLRRFWDMRAALAGVPVAERMAAHYRRLAIVRMPSRHRAMMGNVAAGDGTGPDVRALGVTNASALSMLRHGDSQRMDRLLYCGPELDSLPPPLQPTAAECMASPEGRYRQILMGEPGTRRLLLARAREASLTGDSYYPDYAIHLPLAWQVLRFRGSEGATTIVGALSLPRTSVQALRGPEGRIDALLSIALADTSAGWIRRERVAVRAMAPDSLAPEARTLLHIQTIAPVHRTVAVRLGIESADRTAGRIVATDIDVIDFAADTLAVSDIIIGPRDGERTFRRGDVELTLAPHRVFAADEPFDLYYEVYGAVEDETIETEIVVEPIREGLLDRVGSIFGRAGERIRLSFREPAATPHPVFGLQQVRSVTADGMQPGDYHVRVTITTPATGRSASRESILRIGPGTNPPQRE